MTLYINIMVDSLNSEARLDRLDFYCTACICYFSFDLHL